MKILHVLYSGLGGHGNVFFSMVKADTEKEFEYEALFNGVELIREEYISRCEGQNLRWQFLQKRRGIDLGFYKNLVKMIRQSEPDIVILHGSTQVLWAKIAAWLNKRKCRLIVRETQANHLKTRQDWFWLKAALLLSDKLIFLTEEYSAVIKKKLFWLYKTKKTVLIPNGIDLNYFLPQPKMISDHIRIGMQSRIVKIKDHQTLLRAFERLVKDPSNVGRTITLSIAGDGDYRENIAQLAIDLGIADKVNFTGMLSEMELLQFLTGLDIYIHASHGETMSTAIMQAMACGKPVIASAVPGILNMIQDQITGILVPVEDEQAMYTKILQLINDPGLLQQLARHARDYAERNFSNEIMFDKYKKIFLTI